MGAWEVRLEGVILSGGDDSPGAGSEAGCLTNEPDGMGPPELRTEDVTYVQRDGVKHFGDWYMSRIVTLEDVIVCDEGCPDCPGARQKVRDIVTAWSRKCDDVELVVFTDCHDSVSATGDRSLVGPYGIVGRPRVAAVDWTMSNKRRKCARLLLRFDARDHRMFVLDADGTPGSGVDCVTLEPSTESQCRTYDRCYDDCTSDDVSGWTYQVTSGGGGGPETASVLGTECTYPTITLNATLTEPSIENITTGETLRYNGTVRAGDPPVIIDTQTGTATQGGASRTHLLSGTRRFALQPGDNELRLVSFAASDDGNAEVCFRSTVVVG